LTYTLNELNMFLLSKQIIYRYIMNFGLTEHPFIKLKLFLWNIILGYC
jgi:hypothetical protein